MSILSICCMKTARTQALYCSFVSSVFHILHIGTHLLPVRAALTRFDSCKHVTFSFLCVFSCIFSPDSNKGPEWRKRNPIPGRVDTDRDYQIFLLHIQPAPPPAVLHQMGQVEMPSPCGRDEFELSLLWRTLLSEHGGTDLTISPLACFPSRA